ncbi:MAG: bifunctional adenosylcobinamide kinase/adenosylcobinamide-phosphate guanylyltransferase [Chromatiaceae bacterium]|nr:bifunctional adenosylcobinamide kinase/adenosylcobinamide-phosphate guanylyltransferase [Chromatiaceae bacterium]
MKTLILGGVRSGKSRLAERLAFESGRRVVYVATATAGDDEMARRIEAHRSRRCPDWTVVEEPVSLGRVLADLADPGRCIVVDCLTLWLTNLLTHTDASLLESERARLLEAMPGLSGEILLVGNETNMGVIPMGEISRRYCDEAGLLHQALAACCDRVVLTVAGLSQVLKGPPLDAAGARQSQASGLVAPGNRRGSSE